MNKLEYLQPFVCRRRRHEKDACKNTTAPIGRTFATMRGRYVAVMLCAQGADIEWVDRRSMLSQITFITNTPIVLRRHPAEHRLAALVVGPTSRRTIFSSVDSMHGQRAIAGTVHTCATHGRHVQAARIRPVSGQCKRDRRRSVVLHIIELCEWDNWPHNIGHNHLTFCTMDIDET
jgi:hypothetical protein